MDDLRSTAAAFFRNKGKNVITESEFVMGISMDLRWMPPTDARDLLSALLDGGHITKENEYLRPAFDISAADVPIGFRPSADILKGKKKPQPQGGLLGELMAKAESLGMKRKDFIVSVNSIQKRINVDIEIAALIMLRDGGVDISDYCGRAYEEISKR